VNFIKSIALNKISTIFQVIHKLIEKYFLNTLNNEKKNYNFKENNKNDY
jgi:hypothetical protein